MLQALALAVLGIIGWGLHLSGWYYLGLVGAAVTAGYQYRLCRGRDRGMCLKAFINNSWFGACVFAGLVVSFRLNRVAAANTFPPTSIKRGPSWRRPTPAICCQQFRIEPELGHAHPAPLH